MACIMGKLVFFFGSHRLLISLLFSFFFILASFSSLSLDAALSLAGEYNLFLDRPGLSHVSIILGGNNPVVSASLLFRPAFFLKILSAKYARTAKTHPAAITDTATT